ncbi:MFS transporter [Dictyobacter formicarum]|uniref:MFS transporter n=1 Tax=Dictyobacter formicarum TaxID=2778368 RepID=A0ABQ3VRR1_9CHLR|nr:MFS transporter [Dictyobacter formicarum]GHO88083.1 MFS transporter [Dictyobacter formicarum]
MFPRFSKRLPSWPRLALLINRNYTLLWFGGTISQIGDVLFTTMLILWVGTLLQNQRAAPLAVSGVVLAATLPALLIGPFAGVFVDRWPKQRTMRIMDALRAVLVCSLLPISGPLPLPLAVKLTIIYLVVAAVSGLSQFFTPATKAILKEVVPEEQLTRASALTVGAGVFAWTIGSACAGICYVSLGAGWAIALNAASYACSWMLVGRMRVSAAERRASPQPTSLRRVLTELREGLRFIQGQLQLRTLLLTESLFSFGWGIVSVLAFFYITQNIHVPMSLYGLWMAVTAIGGILGTSLVDRAAAKRGATRVYARALLFVGVMVVVSTVPNQAIIALVGFTLNGTATVQAEALVGPLVLLATPEQMVGRVFSTLGTVTTLSSLLATFLSGYVSSTLLQGVVVHLPTGELNATNLLQIGAGVLIFVGGLHASRQFRKLQSRTHMSKKAGHHPGTL